MRLIVALLSLLSVANAATYQVQVGYEGPKEQGDRAAWYFFRFYPQSIDINVDDTLSYVMTQKQSNLEHTVTFNGLVPQGDGTNGPYEPVGFFPISFPNGPPPAGQPNLTLVLPPLSLFTINPAMANTAPGDGIQRLNVKHNGTGSRFSSGFFSEFTNYAPNGPLSFNVTFTVAGSYEGYCVPHIGGGMKMIVNVRAKDTAYPKNETTVMQDALAAMAQDRASVDSRSRAISRDDSYLRPVPASWFPAPSSISLPSQQYFVRAGVSNMLNGGYATLSRYTPSNIVIKVGDVLHFYSEDADAHTVSITRTDDQTVRDASAPGGRTVWRDWPTTPSNMTHPYKIGTQGYAHSGLMLAEFIPGPPFFQTNPFSVQFTVAGDYQVQCLLHAGMGMQGTIKVLPNVDPSCAATQTPTSVVSISFANMFVAKP